MFDMWTLPEGKSTWDVEPRARVSADRCKRLLELGRAEVRSVYPPKFWIGKVSKVSEFAPPRFVVVHVTEAGAKVAGLNAGYYLSPLPPEEALRRAEYRRIAGLPLNEYQRDQSCSDG